jgi:hypothetical protein
MTITFEPEWFEIGARREQHILGNDDDYPERLCRIAQTFGQRVTKKCPSDS